ncbi:hypothetical protein [Bifidobacterium biavatii]|uniref:Uncharacterized protein n=1 Tax=Bifidobacterium biavatii DSM 23969 TaxID=1437608 RepID=A0A086ZYW9_9BIFI|nr:hypothetical protein [Bifidobacterium biavatii]KFI51719.1 hypothetical protein BBIA_0633 [Bifidobacterium biavatii DSM 23969]
MSDAIHYQTPAKSTLPVFVPPAPPMVRTDTLEPPDWWREIRNRIEHDIHSAPREQQREIGPSELGVDCVHCLAAKLAGWPKRNGRDKGWTPFLGTCLHEHLQHLFDQDTSVIVGSDLRRWHAEMRVHVGQINGLAGSTRVNGSIDLYDRLHGRTIDWKLVGKWSLDHKRRHGMPQQYVIQASLYGIGLQNTGLPVNRNAIVALPKITRNGLDDALIWDQPFDPKPGQWALARASTLCVLLDLIETQDGTEARDAWITSLPKNAEDCFDCHDDTYQTKDLDGDMWLANHPGRLDRYKPFIDLIPSAYPNLTNNSQGE